MNGWPAEPTLTQECAGVATAHPGWDVDVSPDTGRIDVHRPAPALADFSAPTPDRAHHRIAEIEHAETFTPGIPQRTCPDCGRYLPHACTGRAS